MITTYETTAGDLYGCLYPEETNGDCVKCTHLDECKEIVTTEKWNGYNPCPDCSEHPSRYIDIDGNETFYPCRCTTE